jgi:hypothetical protein
VEAPRCNLFPILNETLSRSHRLLLEVFVNGIRP